MKAFDLILIFLHWKKIECFNPTFQIYFSFYSNKFQGRPTSLYIWGRLQSLRRYFRVWQNFLICFFCFKFVICEFSIKIIVMDTIRALASDLLVKVINSILWEQTFSTKHIKLWLRIILTVEWILFINRIGQNMKDLNRPNMKDLNRPNMRLYRNWCASAFLAISISLILTNLSIYYLLYNKH
jgi:hypothetical protein